MPDEQTELRRSFEETTTKNLLSTNQYSKKTRDICQALDEKVMRLQNLIGNQASQLEQYRLQLAALQQRVFKSGSGDLVTAEEVENIVNEKLDGRNTG